MVKRRSVHIPKGMTKDLSASKFGAEFYYDALNVKLTASESNTMLSITNVKSNQEIDVNFNDVYNSTVPGAEGNHIWKYLGHVVLNEYIVLFAQCSKYETVTEEVIVEEDGETITKQVTKDIVVKERDCIFRINTSEAYATQLIAYGDFKFSPSNPIEGLGIYEKEDVQKVYWIDGINQPRLINIVKDTVITDSTRLDFVRTLSFGETVSINRNETSLSAISAGTMQYVFTYYNLYGQESNIFYTSSLHYISYNDRGADAEDTRVGSSFSIKIENPDPDFQYVRIYSIHRTSINATPMCRRVVDLPVPALVEAQEGGEPSARVINFVDDGTMGDSIDPTLLLYVGGRQMFPYTMEQKDNTLFFGNYSEGEAGVSKELKEAIKDANIQFESAKEVTINQDNSKGSFYSYEHQLKKSSEEITTYKYGETYRFGVQLQKATGEWSEPIFIKDLTNNVAPQLEDSVTWNKALLAQASLDITDTNWIQKAKKAGYVNIRPMVVFPSMTDRNIICQGVLNPTVFNVADRATNSPFAQASWFFRPNYKNFSYATSSGAQNLYSDNYVLVAITVNSEYPSNYSNLQRGDIIRLGTREQPSGQEQGSYEIEDELSVIATYSYFGKIQLQSGVSTIEVLLLTKREGVNFIEGSSEVNGSPCTRADAFTGQEVINDLYYEVWTESDKIQYGIIGQVIHFHVPNSYYYLEVWEADIPSGLSKEVNKYLTWDDNAVWIDDNYTLSHAFYGRGTFSKTFNNLTEVENNTVGGVPLQFTHYGHLPFSNYRNAEIQCNYGDDSVGVDMSNATQATKDTFIDKYSDLFFIDQSIVTLNSPDIDFDTNLQAIDNSNLKLRIVGYVPITATISDIDITTSTGPMNFFGKDSLPRGFWHETVGQVGYNGYLGLLSAPMWYDECFRTANADDVFDDETSFYNGYMVYPWHRSGSLNNQHTAVIPNSTGEVDEIFQKLGLAAGVRSAMLERKVMSHLRYSGFTKYLTNLNGESVWKNENVSINLFNSNDVINTKLGKQYYDSQAINYYGNIDKVLTISRKFEGATTSSYPIMATNVVKEIEEGGITINVEDYHSAFTTGTIDIVGKTISEGVPKVEDVSFGYDPIRMKYKSNPHAVICLKGDNTGIDILPKMSGSTVSVDTSITNPFWTQNSITVKQTEIPVQSNYGYLWLGELYDATPKNIKDATRFGGKSEDAIEGNTWLPAGDVVSLDGVTVEGEEGKRVILKWTEGDTYYQRYDCLKTYPFTQEDPNSIVDICSFMVETRVNIDGRYDRNRGQLSNLYMSPQNFNLLNPVYSQQNNYFNYKILNQEMFNTNSYKNYITWSKTKTPGEKTDTWTNVTLANVLDLDGDKGAIQAIKRFNNALFSFQDRGISQILYNENMQLSTTEGVPIEIANSGKVQGKRYISETIGCQNKWSIASSPYGLYFIDANNKTLNRLSQSIEDLTNIFGFNSWAKDNIQKGIWNTLRETEGVYRTLYDSNNKDIFFVGNHVTDTFNEESLDNDCLVYSEMANQFTSFFSWQNALDLFNVGDKLFAIDEEALQEKSNNTPNQAPAIPKDNLEPGGIEEQDDKIPSDNEPTDFPTGDDNPTTENPSGGGGNEEGDGDGNNPDTPTNGESTNESDESEVVDTRPYRNIKLYQQYAGEDFNTFFGKQYPFSVTYVDAQEPFEDKTYSNIEFRAVVKDEKHLPFDYLEAWNEYQKGRAYLQAFNDSRAFLHHRLDKEANLDRRFRMWRCDIPRDNVGMFTNEGGNLIAHPMNRLRNPWIYLKLLKGTEEQGMKEIELHDLIIDYFM